MALAIRHAGAAIELTPIAGLTVMQETDAHAMARIQGRTVGEMESRFAAGHRAWVAWLDGAAAAWGWVASRNASIGELNLAFDLPPGDLYLWNFVTSPAHRGRGIYPRLLDAIVRTESADGSARFWIAYAPENHASAAGIRKAGFSIAAELSFDPAGRPVVGGEFDGRAAAARLLGVTEHTGGVAPCWRCVRAGHATACAAGSCSCDYQKAHACGGAGESPRPP